VFLTPDETAPSPILRAYQRALTLPRAGGAAAGVQPSLPPARNARMQKQMLVLRTAAQAAETD
jgi:hypothetical protein